MASHHLIENPNFVGIKYEKRPCLDLDGNPVDGLYNAWIILDNLVYAALLGAVVHFVTMGFSLKISKKILVKK